jgi:dipeptidyl-peptidase-4
VRLNVAALLTFAISIASPTFLSGSDELNQRLNRIFGSRSFSEKRFGPARWIRGGASFTTLEPSPAIPTARDIIEYSTATGKRSVLVSAAQLKPSDADKPLTIEDYQWDHDLQRLLVFTESRRTWRTNSRGDYWLLDLNTGALKKLGGNSPPSSLMFAKFSPEGDRVAYVRANNLYVEELATNTIRALTSDGSDTLVNGTSDWVYEEELNLRDGFRWSPDGLNIAFWQFDQSGVELFTVIDNTSSLYPTLTRFPYPTAGQKNSAVRVGVVSAEGGPPVWMQIPGDPRENYLFRMDWVNDHELAVGQLNRKQNIAAIYLSDVTSGSAKEIFRDQDEAWVDVRESAGAARGTGGFDWLKDHQAFVWLSERDGWRRAWSVSHETGKAVAVTPEAEDVMSVQGIDPERYWIYYIAAPENATERYLYHSPLDSSPAPPPRPPARSRSSRSATPLAKPASFERLTPPAQHGVHSYDISPDFRWAFHTYSTFDSPPMTELISLPDHKPVRTLEDNAELSANAAGLLEPHAEFLQLPLAEGVSVDAWMLKPRSFDPAKKYPLLVYVYGEPASATVMNQWQGSRALFERAIAADGYLVVSIDNRGTPAPKGRAWRKVIYGAVGVLSAKEQTEAVIALAKARTYVDLSRVGVWGWSGGGSNTLNLMFRSPDLFKVGVAVAPVPDQKLYDTIYQERYMGLPDENAEGYRSGSPINFADGLRGKLLIIHGSGDDNVHFQGTEKLINRLVELGKPFDFMEYPNRSHGIFEGAGTSLHVYSLIARYIEDHLPAGPK